MSILSDDDFVRLFQRTFGLLEDGWAGRDTEAKLRAVAAGVGAKPTRPSQFNALTPTLNQRVHSSNL